MFSLSVLFLDWCIKENGFPSKYSFHGRSSSGSPKRPYIPTLSRIIHCFPPFLRSPRPTCWIYFTKERVGRANCTNSRFGQSKPSENISTFTMISRSPFLKSRTSFFLNSAGVSLSMSAIFIPASKTGYKYVCYVYAKYYILFLSFLLQIRSNCQVTEHESVLCQPLLQGHLFYNHHLCQIH